MKLHHIGIATRSIDEALLHIKEKYRLHNVKVCKRIYDAHEDVDIAYIENKNFGVELVSGKKIDRFKELETYHLCYEVDNIEKAMELIKGIQVSEIFPAKLFDNRRVVFIFTENDGLIELLEN